MDKCFSGRVVLRSFDEHFVGVVFNRNGAEKAESFGTPVIHETPALTVLRT
jgi:hypothetical protein